MKRFGAILFASVLWLSVGAIAQDTGAQQPAGSSQGTTTQTPTTGKKSASATVQHLRGKISDDGKTLTTDKDSKSYTIENPDAVKGHEGHDVRVTGHVDSSNNSIHVTKLKMAGEKASKNKGGSMSEQPPK